MDDTTVSGSGKLPSKGVNAPRKKKLSLSWWRQRKKKLLIEASRNNCDQDGSTMCSKDSTHVLESCGEAHSSNFSDQNRNEDTCINNNIDNDGDSDLWSLLQLKKRKQIARQSSNLLVLDVVARPMEKKLRRESTAAVEFSTQHYKEFTCRFSCDDIFYTFNQRQEHEKLCWLKLPYGSTYICELCGLPITLLSYSSVLHHEEQCNPFSILQSRKCSQSSFEVIPFMQNIKSVNKDAPICCCAYQPTYCSTSVSRSERNPGRKYFRCSKLNVEDHCCFFPWVKDENNYY
jgi:hypothetical protein